MRSQMPVYEEDIKDNYILRNKYAMKQMQMSNMVGAGNTTNYNNFNTSRMSNNTIRQRRPLSAYTNKVNINPNGTHAHENYDQYKNMAAYRSRVPESTGLF